MKKISYFKKPSSLPAHPRQSSPRTDPGKRLVSENQRSKNLKKYATATKSYEVLIWERGDILWKFAKIVDRL